MYNLTVKDVDRSGTKRGQRPCRSGGDATPARLALPAGRRAPAVFNIRYFVSNRLNMKIYIDTAPPPYRVLALDIRQADRRRFLSSRPERPSDVTARSRLSGRTGSASAAPPGSSREGARRRPPPGPRALAARSQQARRAQARLQAAVLAVQVGHERVGRVQARQQPLRRALRVRRARAQRRRLRAPRARGALRGGHALTPTLLRTTSHHICLTVRLQTLIPTHDTYTATRLCSREGRTTPTLAFRGRF